MLEPSTSGGVSFMIVGSTVCKYGSSGAQILDCCVVSVVTAELERTVIWISMTTPTELGDYARQSSIAPNQSATLCEKSPWFTILHIIINWKLFMSLYGMQTVTQPEITGAFNCPSCGCMLDNPFCG